MGTPHPPKLLDSPLRSVCVASLFLLWPTFRVWGFEGDGQGVDDGDTILVLHNGLKGRVRFNGIDLPEKGQACGRITLARRVVVNAFR